MLTSYHWGRHGSVGWWMAEIVMSKLPSLKVEGGGGLVLVGKAQRQAYRQK